MFISKTKTASMLLIPLLLTACSDERFSTRTWKANNANTTSREPIFFDEINPGSVAELHGKTVYVRGVLTYEFDEAAIHPFYEHPGFKPVWIDVGTENNKLHEFLLENRGANTTLVGTLDTTNIPDQHSYGSVIKNIHYVSATIFDASSCEEKQTE
jgi:hypothetical protein